MQSVQGVGVRIKKNRLPFNSGRRFDALPDAGCPDIPAPAASQHGSRARTEGLYDGHGLAYGFFAVQHIVQLVHIQVAGHLGDKNGGNAVAHKVGERAGL